MPHCPSTRTGRVSSSGFRSPATTSMRSLSRRVSTGRLASSPLSSAGWRWVNIWFQARRSAARIRRGKSDRPSRASIERQMTESPAPISAATDGFLFRLLRRLAAVRPEEVAAVGWSWLYIFAVLSSYYIMRPIRDQMGVAGGVNNLQWLFMGTLGAMLLLNSPFGFLVKMLPRTRFISITYRFFAGVILLFAMALHWADQAQTVWIGRIFFIWISVFNLFVVSIFWALIVDIFNSEDGKRLFGFIAAGATIGAIVGSGLTASLARYVPTSFLLIGSVMLLEVAVFSVGRLSRQSAKLRARPAVEAAETPIGGNALAGFTHPFQSAYLFNVSLFLLLFAITSTFLYFQQAGIVSRSFHDRGAQTAFFASVDLAVNALTLFVQLFLTGAIVRAAGVGPALALLHALTLVGFGALALMPTR